MTRQNKRNGDDERELLSAALLAQTGQALGAPPSDGELRDWLRGRVGGDRLEQIESHIAVDPGVFARAMELRRTTAADDEKPRRSRPGMARWFQPGSFTPLAAGIAAVGIAGFAALTLLREPPALVETGTVAGDAPVLRSAARPHPDWRIAAFRAGFEQQTNGTALDAAITAVSPDRCLDGTNCPRLAGSLVEFGALVAAVEKECALGTLDLGQRAALAAGIEAIETSVSGSLELTAWYDHLDAMKAALRAGETESCAQRDALRELLLTD